MTEPLTAEEIARLNEALDPALKMLGDDPLPGWSDLALRLLDEVERSRALLRRIEWNGQASEGTEGGACPECGGEAHLHIFQPKSMGHKPGCELAALLR